MAVLASKNVAGFGDADALVRHPEEGIVELPGVVQVEHAAADFVDLVRAEDVRVGDRDRGVLDPRASA